jgi:cytochrome c553
MSMRSFALPRAVVYGILLVAGTAAAEEQPAGKVDLAKAQQIVSQVCAACHGNDGNSVASANPSLAGQPAQYIALQLQHFKSGIRPNPIMAGMSAALTPEDMTALGAYFSQQKPKGSVAKNRDLADKGQKIYRGGRANDALPACSACHAPDGAGMPAQYPRLSGQSSDYVYDQLKKFKSGERGNNDKDASGRIMTAVAARLSDEDMHALAEYTAGLH